MLALQGKTILVVDDEAGYREVLADEFRMAGATVLAAENGGEGLALVRSQRVDAIVSDVRMAGGNGIELLEQIKATDPTTPVVMLITGYSDLPADIAYDKGADAIFAKPFALEDLVEAVVRAVTPKRERLVRRVSTRPEDFVVDLTFASFEQAIQARLLNIGRGGMFLAFAGPMPHIGKLMHFCITTPTGKIAGEALCRWVRSKAQPGLARGIGLEFQSLTEAALAAVDEMANQFDLRPFIPKN